MAKRNTITAVVPVKNEEKNIKRCLRSLNWCDKIIVMSMGSDSTAEIAREMGAEVVEQNKSTQDDFLLVQKNINWAIDHAKTDWILRVDADEEVTEGLRDEILQILANGTNCVAYGVPRKQYFLDDFLKGGDWAYDRLVRLFKKSHARYEPLSHVHEQLKVNGNICYLKNALNHYSHPDLKTLKEKFESYTSVQVYDLHDSTLKAIFNMLFQPPYIFLRWMIWHHGYRDGLRGIQAGALRGWYDFLLYRKYLAYKLKQTHT